MMTTLAAAQATTGLTPGRVMVWGAIGFQIDAGGSVNSSGTGVVMARRAEIDSNTWGERFDAALDVRTGVAYNITNRSQLFGALHWEQAEADEALLGLLGGQPLNGKFGDYQGWGIDFGYRRVFATTMPAKPFIAGSLGFQHFNAIDLTLSSPANSFSAPNVPFYDDSWVTEWRLGTGILWDVTPKIGWQVSIDLKYSGVLSDQSGIGTLGFDRVNDTGNRWSLPVLGGVYVKF
jgi:hypothetical protein